MIKEIVNDLPLFDEKDKKEKFIQIVGALVLRLISLRKASELLKIEEKTLIEILNSLGIEYSYLEKEDVEIEKELL